MSRTALVTNLSPETSQEQISNFFSFCGKIQSIKLAEGETVSATIEFEFPGAMGTALLLNNTKFGPNVITVKREGDETGADDDHHGPAAHAASTSGSTGQISQEEKPRARVLAEYLAQGYVIGDAAITRALELDSKHGVIARFFGTLQQLDERYHATDKARAADQSYGVTQRASSWFSGIGSYFEKASTTPTGKKIVDFYTKSQHELRDVHNEAKRLMEQMKEEAGGSSVKAAGLERVLGKDNAATDSMSGTTSATPAAATESIPVTRPVDEAKKQ